jgi:hypothetical protein
VAYPVLEAGGMMKAGELEESDPITLSLWGTSAGLS